MDGEAEVTESTEDFEVRLDIPFIEQPLSDTASSEMGQREEWNLMNPPLRVTLVKNLRELPLIPRKYRNTKARFFSLTGDRRLQPHLSELPPLGKSVNHRHTTEAVMFIVKGAGYTVMSYEGGEEHRVDWEEGDMFGIPLWAWHQHFNSSETDTARYLAIQDTLAVKSLGLHQIERHPTKQ
jgi:mannose-6-phosphate isomerase-like protein (cupin superfamily)